MKKKKEILKNNWVNYFLPGLFLLGISLGSVFAFDLIRFGYFFLIAVVLIALFYYNHSLAAHFFNRRLNHVGVQSGFVGLFLLSLFFGTQTTQLPFKLWVLGLGVVLILISLWRMQKR